MQNIPTAIFLSGPIGVGKSTLGAALARALHGSFVEGDAHSDPDKPWYASRLSTARSILRSVVAEATETQPVVIAYPLGCIDWIFYNRHLAERGIRMFVVSLAASYRSIINPKRRRLFSAEEQARIRQMIAEGYDRRAFSDFVVRTDRESEAETLRRLVAEITKSLGTGPA